MSVEVVDALKHVDTGKETGSLDTSADNTKQVEESAVGANSEVVMLAVEEGCWLRHCRSSERRSRISRMQVRILQTHTLLSMIKIIEY